ncbi:autotransporter assembly complex protein TamA [Thalassovita gelatinovora]|uniref:autotransporter assembly complex protein TamA n=1 Tax=Thalassovita gelatinovora TaxID=53501 RepID=UPI00071C863C|nr:autotransporter assembly complex family protein [Thalassovita gelatinovora]
MRHISPLLFCAVLAAPAPALALNDVTFTLGGEVENDTLLKRLRGASLLRTAQREEVSDPQDLFSTALADYQRMVETLYALGYYSGTVSIRIDGREAALIPALNPPKQINDIEILIDPGKPFRFETTEIAPLAAGTQLPEGFRRGERARAEVVIDAARNAVDGWRDIGHAKAKIAAQRLVADHAAQTLAAEIAIAPGPQVRFGDLVLSGDSKVRAERIRRIAGLPSDTIYSPAELKKVATRLRRSGAFRSVAVTEDERLKPGNRMDIGVAVVDDKPRRFGAGVELSTYEGLTLSGFWMHRNLLGGAERLRIDAEIAGIEGQNSGIDYTLGARIERPAVYGADTKGYIRFDLESLDEPDYQSDEVSAAIGATRIFSDHLQGSIEIELSYSETDDVYGQRDFTLAALPMSLEWDRRDDTLNPKTGHYLDAGVTPFVGLNGEASGAQATFDGRIYRRLDPAGRLVVAGRLQLGSVVGPALSEASPNYLFYSGGGGTVRGQPYQSLGVDVGGGSIGGRSFVGLSAEIRAKLTEKISVVGFGDTGYVGAESFYDGSGNWHSGAGIGLRYDTTVGPLRLDVAAPVSGDTGDGVQIYIGIGQAF